MAGIDLPRCLDKSGTTSARLFQPVAIRQSARHGPFRLQTFLIQRAIEKSCSLVQSCALSIEIPRSSCTGALGTRGRLLGADIPGVHTTYPASVTGALHNGIDVRRAHSPNVLIRLSASAPHSSFDIQCFAHRGDVLYDELGFYRSQL